MKKFFVAVCICGLAAFNVSAQERVAETTVIAPAVQEAVAPVAETPAPAQTDSVVEGGVVDQTYSAAPVDCGCGQAAPVYAAAAAPSDCGCEAVDPCAPAVDPCCETARPRLFSRLRERFSRSNDDCCCE